MTARIADIVTMAANMALINRSEILGKARHSRLVRVRQACYLVAREQGHSYPFIGVHMRRDHSTVLYGAEKATILCERDQVFAAFVDALRKAVKDAKPFIQPKPVQPAKQPDNVVLFRRDPRMFDHPPTPLWAVDELDLLSMRVAAHYAPTLAQTTS